MAGRSRKPAAPGFVVLRQVREGRWELLGEAAPRPGLTARAARSGGVGFAGRVIGRQREQHVPSVEGGGNVVRCSG